MEPTEYSIKRKVEEAFAAHLNDHVDGAVSYTSKSDEEDPPLPYIAVIAASADEIIPRSNAYTLDLRVVLVTGITDATSDDHELMVGRIKCALDSISTPWTNLTLGLLVNGFAVAKVAGNGSDGDEVWGDVWTLRVGAQG